MIARHAGLRSSWIWLLSLFTFGSFIETIFWGQISAFTPLYLPKLGIAAGDVARWTGMIAAVSGVLGLPFLPLWGALADRFTRQPIIIRSFVVHLLAGIVAALAGNVWVFLLGRSIGSLALGNSGLMMATLSERVPADRQGLAFSIMNTASPIGAFIGPLLGGPILDRWGFQTLIAIDSALLLGVVLALAIGYRDAYRGADQGSILGMAADSLRIVTRSARLRALFPALFLLFAGWMLALTYVPLVVAQLYTGPDVGTVVGVVMGGGGLLALGLGPLLGTLADRHGAWRVLFGGALLMTVLWPLPALARGLVPVGALWAVINGLSAGVFAISFSVLAGSARAEVRGRVMSFAYLPVNIGLIVGPAIGSVVTRGSLFAVFPVAAVLTALGIALLAVASRQAVSR